MSMVLWMMIGGAIGFFTAALCKSAGRADSFMEKMEGRYIPSMLMESSEEITPEKPKE